MSKNLFGEALVTEEIITFLYKGDSFEGGKVLLKPLYTELQSLENLLRDSVDLFIKSGKLEKSTKDFKIYIEIEKGSIHEKIKVVFSTPTGIAVLGSVVGPFLIATYTHFLNGRNTPENNQFYQEIKNVEDSPSFKENLSGVLSPLGQENDAVIINNGTINININHAQRTEIEESLAQEIDDVIPLKNGEYQEILIGTIRKIDLDAAHQNYLGFNIDSGPARIPTSIRGSFNYSDYKDVIDVHVKVDALVRYKDDKITHVEIIKVLEVTKPQPRLDI